MFWNSERKTFQIMNQMKFKSAPHHFPLYFLYFEEVLLSSLMKILECPRVSELDYCSNGIQINFKTPFHFVKWKKSYYLHSRVLCWMNLNSWRSKCKMKVLGKSFYSLSFNFQEVLNFHSISHNQSHNKQTNNHNNLFKKISWDRSKW